MLALSKEEHLASYAGLQYGTGSPTKGGIGLLVNLEGRVAGGAVCDLRDFLFPVIAYGFEGELLGGIGVIACTQ